MNDLSVIIPTYNAALLIEGSLTKIRSLLDKKNIVYEIVVCDDFSLDASWSILEAFSKVHRIRIYRNDSNQGLGFTLRRLISLSRAENIIYCDIDLPFGTEGVEVVFDRMKEADIVVASRYLDQKAYVPLIRRGCSRIYCFLARGLLNVTVRDIGSGTVGFKKSIIEKLALESHGFDIHLELYAKARRCGCVIKEIGLSSVRTPKGSFSILRHGPRILIQTIRWWRRLKRVSIEDQAA